MKILRTGEKRTGGALLQCEVLVRADFAVVCASEWYYGYVATNSYLPITDLLEPSDAAILKEAVPDLKEPVELITRIFNRREEGYRNVYLRLENSDRTEDGNPLYKITLQDILDLEYRRNQAEQRLAKYRYFLTLKKEYYFEYTQSDNRLKIYKYVNERALRVVDADMDEYVEKLLREGEHTQVGIDQLNTFRSHLKNSGLFFDMEFVEDKDGKKVVSTVKGGACYRNPGLCAGIIVPDQENVKEAYYLTEAAKDAGTGLLNKKAATEYAIEKIQAAAGKTLWFIVMDIDDFKNINDSYGHLFGDEVLREVADTLLSVVGQRGIVGRFGGDEFFLMLEKVQTREDLKKMLKVISKRLAMAFDPKCTLTSSIGISQYPKDSTSFEELFGMADKALYIAKEKGKNRHIIYEEKLHGAYTEGSVGAQAVAYATSREKRRGMLNDIMSRLYLEGPGYVTEQPEVQKSIRSLFDLDGLTIYSDYGREALCRNGSYINEPVDMGRIFRDEAQLELFGQEDMLVITTLERLKAANFDTSQIAVEQEVGAAVWCIVRKGGEPFGMVCFDVFNQNRKWSDNDVELMGMIGACLGAMISGEHR